MIDNFTPFGASATFAYDLDDTKVVVLAVAGTFRMPRAGIIDDGPLATSDNQPPPPLADEHLSNPATSSLRIPGQGSPLRPRSEIYLQGSAWAPRAHPVSHVQTRISVGSCRKDVNVVGDRYWYRGFTAIRSSAPAPFRSMPLNYERAFGGTVKTAEGAIVAQEPRNPIGRGFHANAKDAVDSPIHNLEMPAEPVGQWSNQLTPWGYGPIPGSWQPRLSYGGTYDERWAKTRLPLWPTDTDRRFFNAAAPGLLHEKILKGGEPVELEGFDPDGTIAFKLPQLRVVAKSYFGDRVERTAMRLGAVLLDTETHLTTLFWHHAVPLGRDRQIHLRSVVRLLESWEADS